MSTSEMLARHVSNHDADGTTRRQVLELVASRGPVTAGALATVLELTAPAVRRHLTLLEEDGKIEHRIPGHEAGYPGTARRGRPARQYVVTSGGQSELAGGYQEIARQALRFLKETGGSAAVAGFAKDRFDTVARGYASHLTAADVEGRAAQLVQLLSADGYAASVRPIPAPLTGTPSGRVTGMVTRAVQLCQGHCPIQHVAEEFPELCEQEARAFSELLGSHVQRLATIAGGAHACTTNIPVSLPVNLSAHPSVDVPVSLPVTTPTEGK